MDITSTVAISGGISLFIFGIGLLIKRFTFDIKIIDRISAVESKLSAKIDANNKEHSDRAEEKSTQFSCLVDRITALETKIDPFWRIIELQLPRILHSPHTPELDRMLELYEVGKLPSEDIPKLKDTLLSIDAETNPPDYGFRLTSAMLIAKLDQLIGAQK